MEIQPTVPVPAKDGEAVSRAPLRKAEPATMPAESPAERKDPEITGIELAAAVANINDHVQVVRRELQFNVDDVTGQVVIKVLDSDSQDMVRQIPSEVVLDLARRLQAGEPISGTLLDELI